MWIKLHIKTKNKNSSYFVVIKKYHSLVLETFRVGKFIFYTHDDIFKCNFFNKKELYLPTNV